MPTVTRSIELEDDAVMWFDVEIEFDIHEGDPGDHWTPPTDAEIEFVSVRVFRAGAGDNILNRVEALEGVFKVFDIAAKEYVENRWDDEYTEDIAEDLDESEQAARDDHADQERDRRREEAM